jgi:hypothetical protein
MMQQPATTHCVSLLPLHHTPPAATENLQSEVLRSWYPVLLIFTFNITDFVGRCPPDFGWTPRQTTLLLLCLAFYKFCTPYLPSRVRVRLYSLC